MAYGAILGEGEPMSMAWGAPHLSDSPSVARQVVRATVGTFSVLAVLGALLAAYLYGGGAASALWWRVAGDADVVLADGVVLPDAPPAAVTPTMSVSTATLATGLDALAAPFGGDPVVVTTSAEARALAPYLDPSMWGDRATLVVPLAVTPAGVLRIEPATDGMAGSVRLWAGPEAPVAVTAAEQSALVARLSEGVLAASGSTVAVTSLPTLVPTSGSGALWTVELGLPGCDVCRVSTWDVVTFDRNGRLTNASLTLAAITGLAPITVPSAQQAFDDARHHRGDASVWMQGAPVGAATLTVADLGSLQPFTMWNLVDTSGQAVGQVPVPPES